MRQRLPLSLQNQPMDRQQTKSLVFIAVLLAALPFAASAELYHCAQGDRKIISDRPCDGSRVPVRSDVRAAPVVQSVQSPARENVLTGYVVSVADGDTITVLDASRQQHKIRLAGIDAPEKKQPFGDRSRQNLAAMVFNKTVDVEWGKQDRYGRTLGKVMVNGVDANLEQIKAGLAWWYEKYRREQSPEDQRRYSETEQHARAARVGLWRDSAPVAPWDWRKRGR